MARDLELSKMKEGSNLATELQNLTDEIGRGIAAKLQNFCDKVAIVLQLRCKTFRYTHCFQLYTRPVLYVARLVPYFERDERRCETPAASYRPRTIRC